MSRPDHDPGLEHEPHLRDGPFQTDPSEHAAARRLQLDARKETDDDRVEHTVWDEPALSGELTGSLPAEALTYAGWIEQRRATVSVPRSWLVVAGLAVASGPFGILGAMMSGGESSWAAVVIVVLAPVVEEMMKAALPLWVVEKRPFFFLARGQIVACVLASALVFAAIENLLYLKVYVDQPSEGLVFWRWTICVMLHLGCSLIASLGLMRLWDQAMNSRTRPQLTLAAPYLMAAMLVHGAYNAFAVLISILDVGI